MEGKIYSPKARLILLGKGSGNGEKEEGDEFSLHC